MLSHATGLDSLFRVVSKLQSPELKFTYWGVENMDPTINIWGVDIPALRPGHQIKIAVLMECPSCSSRENLYVDETLLAAVHEKGGMERTCTVCKNPGLWKLLPYHGVLRAHHWGIGGKDVKDL
jgi:hypothetical protein